MTPRARLLFSALGLAAGLTLLGCAGPPDPATSPTLVPVDVSRVPATTVAATDTILRLRNGVYYLGIAPYSGLMQEVYPGGAVRSRASYSAGLQHGSTRTYFENGQLQDARSYRAGRAYGRHVGFWPNGHRKFDFLYADDKREGSHKQWYESGNIYCDLYFADDREMGMQQAWRENGKVYINYAVRDGARYGLQKSTLCYTLRDGQLK